MLTPTPVHMTPTGEFLIQFTTPSEGDVFYRVRTTSDPERDEPEEAEPASLSGGFIAIWKAVPVRRDPRKEGSPITLAAILEQMDRQGRSPAKNTVQWVRILSGVPLSSPADALLRIKDYQGHMEFLRTPYGQRPPVPTPTLTQIDLGQAHQSFLPGVKADGATYYLARIDGAYYVNTFTLVGTARLVFGDEDFEAPGWNQSRWEALWLLEDAPAVPKPPLEGR